MDFDKTDIAAVYDAARGYSQTTQSHWRDVIVQSVEDYEINHILDLGCGTGRYTSALAQWLDAEVVGVDLSEKMLAKAKKTSAPGVSFRIGAAEAIPLEEGSVDMVFMSMVFHHLKEGSEQHATCASCREVLRENGILCMRAGTAEQIEAYPYTPFFEEVRGAFARRLQPLPDIVHHFSLHGFRLRNHQVVTSEVAPDWPAFAAKIALRADSTLNLISDADFEQGLETLKAYARTAGPGPVTEPIDYLVFQRIE